MRTLLFLLLAAPALQDSKNEFSNKDHGFKISRPDAAWSFQEPAAPAGTRYALRIHPADAKKEFSVTIYIADRGAAADLDALLAASEASHKARADCSNVRRVKETLIFDVKAGGDTYRLAQRHVLDGDRLFIVQTAALPEADRKPLDAIAKTFAVTGVSLASRCGSEVPWAKDWEDAAKRARDGRKLIVVIFELYGGFKVPRLAPWILFSDPDVVGLVKDHFIMLRWDYGMKGAIQDPSVYGFGGSAFGRAVVFFTPEGKVVGDMHHIDPVFFDHYARRLLRERGELDETKELAKETDPVARARWFRRLRQGAEALEELKKAPEGAERLAEEGLVLLRLGRTAEGVKALEKLARDHAKTEAALRARFLLGLARSDSKLLRKLVEEKPDSPWAWRAAAALELFELGATSTRLSWVDEPTILVADDSPYASVEDVNKAEQDGVAFLVTTQRKDGSWIITSQVSMTTPSFVTATTAICGSSLIRFGKKEEVRRALEYVMGAETETKGVTAFNYAVWARGFSLRFLAECVAAAIGDKAKTLRAMQLHIDALEDEQAGLGGWSYVNLTEVGGAKDPSMGFVTAMVLLALLDAKAAGAKVAPKTIERAVACLSSMKGPDGSFSYQGGAGRADAESSRRSPAYALALKRAGAGDAVKASLDHHLKFLAATRKERSKTLCHTGPEGTASYYLLYGARFAAEAAADAPAEVRRAIVQDVLSFRCADGGFLDSPVEGRTYGTGMALIALGYAGK